MFDEMQLLYSLAWITGPRLFPFTNMAPSFGTPSGPIHSPSGSVNSKWYCRRQGSVSQDLSWTQHAVKRRNKGGEGQRGPSYNSRLASDWPLVLVVCVDVEPLRPALLVALKVAHLILEDISRVLRHGRPCHQGHQAAEQQ